MRKNFFSGEWYTIDNLPSIHDETWVDTYGDKRTKIASQNVILWDEAAEDYTFARYEEDGYWNIDGIFISGERMVEHGFTHWTFPPKPPKED